MDRTREARRVTLAVAATNGLSRRRHRSGCLRDSSEDDGPVDFQEMVRLRDPKKDRDTAMERERERDRLSRTSKRRRGNRLISNREDGGNDTSEESVNDDEDDDEDGGGTGGGGSLRMLSPNTTAGSLSTSNHHHLHPQQHHQYWKSFPRPVKVIRMTLPAGKTVNTTTTTSSTCKAANEVIGVPVPRKARSGREVEEINEIVFFC